MPWPPTYPATLNGSNAVAANALGVWLVQADVDVPDLKGVQGNLIRSGVTFSSLIIGRSFAPNAIPGYLRQWLTASLTTLPIVIGTVFTSSGTKFPGSGVETIWAIGDNTAGINTYACILLDDGTDWTAGHITARSRIHAGQAAALIDSGITFTSDAANAAVLALWSNSGSPTATMFVGGSKVYESTTGMVDMSGDSLGTMGMLTLVRSSVGASPPDNLALSASILTSDALGFVSHTKLADAEYINWTADPTIMFQAPVTATRGRGTAVL